MEDFNNWSYEEQIDILNEAIPNIQKELYKNPNYIEHVRIGMSTLTDNNNKSIGLGLFATRPFKEKAIIGRYEGDIVTTDMVNDVNFDSTYTASLNENLNIDSNSPFSCFTRYINDGMTEEKNNCLWLKVGKSTMKIKAKQYIEAGEELFLDYGNYWAEHSRFEILSDANKLLLYDDDRDRRLREWIDTHYVLRGNKFHRVYDLT